MHHQVADEKSELCEQYIVDSFENKTIIRVTCDKFYIKMKLLFFILVFIVVNALKNVEGKAILLPTETNLRHFNHHLCHLNDFILRLSVHVSVYG